MSPTTLIAAAPARACRAATCLAPSSASSAPSSLVNGAMIYGPSRPTPGWSPTSPIARASPTTSASPRTSARRALGWTETLEVGRDGRVTLALAERDGRAVRGLKVEGVLGRPATNRQDVKLALAETAPGRYEAHAAAIAEGSWLITLEAREQTRRRADLPHAEAPVAQAMTPTALETGTPLARASAGSQDAPHPVTTILAVENMHCGGCMRKVETALAAVPGVASARANLSARRVTAVHGAAGGRQPPTSSRRSPAPASRLPSSPRTPRRPPSLPTGSC